MTPAEFEWAVEQTELAYERGEIGKITFMRRMQKLGFKDIDMLRQMLEELAPKQHG